MERGMEGTDENSWLIRSSTVKEEDNPLRLESYQHGLGYASVNHKMTHTHTHTVKCGVCEPCVFTVGEAVMG